MTQPAPALAPASGTRTTGSKLWLFEVALWIALPLLAFLFPSRLLLFNEIAILALFALSLDIIIGYAGIVSLGHGAFFGLGAYAAGLLAKAGGGTGILSEPLVGLACAAGVGAVAGFVASLLLLRGADLTRLMVTLGVALIVQELANRLDWITGGADGLQGVLPGPVAGTFAFDMFGRTAYLYSLGVLFVLFMIARRMMLSPFGLSLRAIKGNTLRASAIGVPVRNRLIAAYTTGAIYAAVAGALLAQTTQFVSLDVLDFHRSADVVLVIVFGGLGTLYGAIVGAGLFKLMYDLLAAATPQYWQFWLGLALVALVLFARGGVMGILAQLWRKITGTPT